MAFLVKMVCSYGLPPMEAFLFVENFLILEKEVRPLKEYGAE